MFNYARDHQPCIIFMDEIDAIGGRRFSEGTSADREIQRTLMELLNQMDGFDSLGQVFYYLFLYFKYFIDRF
jgi:26S proteasome regulatory subunit T4